MSVSYNFQGRRVLVTGGARGLGKGIVAKFVGAGATVFALDRLESALKDLKKEFPTVETICIDLLNWEESKKAVEALAPIHHLVNNAGVGEPQPFMGMTPDTIDRILGVNFKAMINMGQVVAAGISEKGADGGTIVNMSSIMDHVTMEGIGMYSCTKAAVTMLTKVMALELGPLNIRVNCIRPSLIQTGILDVTDPHQLAIAEALGQFCVGRQIVKRLVTVEEAADAVLYLSSNASTMVNGSDILVDGGFYTN